MRSAKGQRALRTGLYGLRTAWDVVGDGEFFCQDCGGDRNYRRLTGRHRFTVLGVPLVRRGGTAPVVECADCRARFGTEALEHPTTTRFSAMLREAVHTVALAVLASGGTPRTALETAAATIREAGLDDCSQERLLTVVEVLTADIGQEDGTGAAGACGAALAIELHEVLTPLADHLVPAGRESVLLQGARIALADGPYGAAEREVLTTVGHALRIRPEDTARLLTEAARTPS
ncbi:TerB family tellurite resistance protein [Streptomyces sp. NBC_01218]|uniref:TerB family tellurite resistance protein n=1 Tax=unclassified Streptomyces TaxID=2593676 RepID=UPI0023B9E40D|nr:MULTISPECIES: TerB family tellurite resistance protein [unclassified Streptomyces]WEH41891.1 TerB family tellurite resistance protein [Streptomyces sp. AM 2-1-1]WSQ53503.1 TerB family tellurite resistance protein [Streptomyces sp. NBC_01218]